MVRTHESTRKLARRIETGTARIRSVTLSQQRGRWHVSLSVELPDLVPTPRIGGPVVGVDLGINSLAVLSAGETVPNPRHLDRSLAALRRAQRKVSRRHGPDRRTQQVPSNRWHKAKARVTALHTRVANSRRDGLHQLTTRLVRGHDTIVIEDLHVAGMIPKSAPRPGHSERQFVCETCGTRIDRDSNAAMNLATFADQDVLGELRPDVSLPAGNPRKTAIGGNGYSHGKTQIMSQRRPRGVVAP